MNVEFAGNGGENLLDIRASLGRSLKHAMKLVLFRHFDGTLVSYLSLVLEVSLVSYYVDSNIFGGVLLNF